eukprot:1159252-Karenia_brevis.AAC.1
MADTQSKKTCYLLIKMVGLFSKAIRAITTCIIGVGTKRGALESITMIHGLLLIQKASRQHAVHIWLPAGNSGIIGVGMS